MRRTPCNNNNSVNGQKHYTRNTRALTRNLITVAKLGYDKPSECNFALLQRFIEPQTAHRVLQESHKPCTAR